MTPRLAPRAANLISMRRDCIPLALCRTVGARLLSPAPAPHRFVQICLALDHVHSKRILHRGAPFASLELWRRCRKSCAVFPTRRTNLPGFLPQTSRARISSSVPTSGSSSSVTLASQGRVPAFLQFLLPSIRVLTVCSSPMSGQILTSSNAMANTAVGTPYYLSPEMCDGKPFDQKSDVWCAQTSGARNPRQHFP